MNEADYPCQGPARNCSPWVAQSLWVASRRDHTATCWSRERAYRNATTVPFEEAGEPGEIFAILTLNS